MTNPKKIRITVYLDKHVYDALRELAHCDKTTHSFITNDALANYLIDTFKLRDHDTRFKDHYHELITHITF